MKKSIPLFITLLLTVSAVFTSAQQVRQIYKILEYPSNKPLAGASCTLYGQTITTNAKGVAVLNLPKERKGDYLPREAWYLDQYQYLGRTPSSQYQYFQSNDTLKLYMIKTADLRTEELDLFTRYYNFSFPTHSRQLLAYNDSLRLHPERDKTYAQTIINFCTSTYSKFVSDVYADAQSTIHLYSYDKDTQGEIPEILRGGDVGRAVAAAKAQIKPDDNSKNNLQRIAYYLTLRDMNLATEDTQPTLDYNKILYEQHYSINSTPNYIFALLGDKRYDKAYTIAQKEKDNLHLPSVEYAYQPYPYQYFNKDNDSLQLIMTQNTRIFQNNYRKYPSTDMLDDLAWQYRSLILMYEYLTDTTNTNLMIDSTLLLYNQCISDDKNDIIAKNQNLIWTYSSIVEYLYFGFSSKMDSTLLAMTTAIRQAAKENYTLQPDNLFMQLQYAARTNDYIDVLSMNGQDDSLLAAALRDLSVINEILAVKYPEMFTVENMVTKSQLLGVDMSNDPGENNIRTSFRKFKETYPTVNSLYPDIFTSTYLSFVSAISDAAHNSHYTLLAADADTFIDELLRQAAQKAGHTFDVQKAQYLNNMAEQIYHQQDYAKSIHYYEQANEYFQKATVQDPTQWTPFLRNFLQMGDAYLYQGQFMEALNTYHKVLTYENQIPADQAASYTLMKGNVSYYEGDLWGEQGDAATAEKCYKKAEKLFKKAVQLGDASAYHSLGEMSLTRAIRQYKQGNVKNVYPLTEQSVKYYESYPIEQPLQRYVQAKSIIEDYYWNKKDSVKYVNNLRGFADYYHKFAEYDTFYVKKSIEYTAKLLRYNLSPEDELRYNRNIVTDYERILPMTGLTLPYLQRNFQLAKAYQAVDSIPQAIKGFEECLSLNAKMYLDTAPKTCMANEIDIYKALIECNSTMGEQYEDEESVSQEWYGKALNASDTLIRIMERLRKEDDADQTYRLALQYYRNAILCTQTEWTSIALTQLDKSNNLLIELYNDKYKDETEFEIIRNYYVKGLVAEDMSNTTLAKECYQAAVGYAEKASDLRDVADLYYAVVNNWLEILEHRDGAQDTATITKLKQAKASLSKWVKKSK